MVGLHREKIRTGIAAAVFIMAVFMCTIPVSAAGQWTPEEGVLYGVKDQPLEVSVVCGEAVLYGCDTAALPAGLTFDEAAGKVEGSASQAGESIVTFRAYDEGGNEIGTKEYTFRITEAPCYRLTASVNNGAMGQIEAGGGDGYWPEGTNLPVIIKAMEGYVIESVMLNGIEVSDLQQDSREYSMELIMDSDQELYAVFKEVPVQEPVSSVSENSAPEPEVIDAYQMQTVNYKDEVLTDWQQILPALKILTPEKVVNPDEANKILMLQLQNVKSIPAELKDNITQTEGSEYTKVFQCNLGYGASIVFHGSADNSNFRGISNLNVKISSEPRGKKSIATSIAFESHEDFGTVASLQVNLPDCRKGTKVSVYAETMTGDTLGENVCIGTTKADEQGNVEVPIQTTSNYLFLYKK